MAIHITIKVPSKHPQTDELTTFALKDQRMDIDISTPLTRIPIGYRITLLGG
ncbi:hypothetical protein ACET9Z_16005 [Aeromonas veronii]|uniref:hypothetical protein n=1 Tax=Aeromonas TaxID=642 RepID=UPI00191FC469|nr:hypothetical protein [Aeromonas jandaei]MBL0597585.1 hypothetical protein [Aeromonas jandaei]